MKKFSNLFYFIFGILVFGCASSLKNNMSVIQVVSKPGFMIAGQKDMEIRKFDVEVDNSPSGFAPKHYKVKFIFEVIMKGQQGSRTYKINKLLVNEHLNAEESSNVCVFEVLPLAGPYLGDDIAGVPIRISAEYEIETAIWGDTNLLFLCREFKKTAKIYEAPPM